MPLRPRLPTSTGTATTPTKGEVTAERILDAAFKSIAAHGCGAVTLRGIAEEAGVVLSQLNYYYGNKDSLFVAVMKRMQQDYMHSVDERLRGHDTLEGQIMALIDYNQFVLDSSPDTYRNFLEFSNFAMTSSAFRNEIANFTSEVVDLIESCIVRHGSKNNIASGFSAAEVSRYILSASFGIALQHFLGPKGHDVCRGFDIVKATAAQLIKQNRRERSWR